MKKISGNKLLVKALKEEGVDILFGYPGACTIDISDEIYKQDYTKVVLQTTLAVIIVLLSYNLDLNAFFSKFRTYTKLCA